METKELRNVICPFCNNKNVVDYNPLEVWQSIITSCSYGEKSCEKEFAVEITCEEPTYKTSKIEWKVPDNIEKEQ